MERDKEYDAFGPWIYEIGGEYEVPKLFKNCFKENENYLILFKVPRNIERRKASPGMDLYDFLIGACETCLYIWRRAGKNVIEKRIDYGDILAVKDVHALLRGELIIYSDNESIKVVYNTVSEEIIMKFINIIMQKAGKETRNLGTDSLPVEHVPGRPDSFDFLFVNLFNKISENKPEIRLAAYQPGLSVKRTREIRQKLKDKNLIVSKSAFITGSKELIILERKMSYRKKATEDLDYSYYYMPYGSIKYARTDIFDEEQRLDSVEISAGNNAFGFLFAHGNQSIMNLVRALNELNN